MYCTTKDITNVFALLDRGIYEEVTVDGEYCEIRFPYRSRFYSAFLRNLLENIQYFPSGHAEKRPGEDAVKKVLKGVQKEKARFNDPVTFVFPLVEFRKEPLLSALSSVCTSVPVSVHVADGKMYVIHEKKDKKRITDAFVDAFRSVRTQQKTWMQKIIETVQREL